MSLPQQICQQHGLKLLGAEPLSGGDINDVYKLNTDQGYLVLKLNSASHFPGMFGAEANGLNHLANAACLRIPKVEHTGTLDGWSYLLLEYIEPGSPSNNFWETFGHQLATQHQHSRSCFGLDQDNYIGSLPQSNSDEDSLIDFYTKQRLHPQIAMARKAGYRLDNYEAFEANLNELLPEEPPALIHGDLWSGNYLVDSLGEAVLIDPAVCYGSREMDLAMMRLFGGFSPELWVHYQEVFPLAPDWETRVPIWQLYYLLVHLNLFGRGYLGQVERIIDGFS